MRTRKLIIAGILLFLVVPVFGQRGRYQGPPSIADIKWNNAISVSPSDYAGHGTLQGACNAISLLPKIGTLSNSNRGTLILTSGTYTYTSGYITIPRYVDLIGIGSVYIDLGNYGFKNTSVTETGNSVTNKFVNLTIYGQQPICWSNGTGLSVCEIDSCNLISTLDSVYAGNTSKTIRLWSCTLDSTSSGVTIGTSKASCEIDLYNCMVRVRNTTGEDSSYGPYVYGINQRGASSSLIKLYSCFVSSYYDASTATEELNPLAAAIFLPGSGVVNCYAGTYSATAITDGALETATAYGVFADTTATGTMNMYNCVVETSSTVNGGPGTTKDYYNHSGVTDTIKLYDSFGTFSTVDVVTPVPIASTIACDAATDMADYPNGSSFSNEGATGTVAFTAPPAVKGARIGGVSDVVNTAGADITVTCTGSDVFIDPDDGTTTYTVYSHTADLWGIVGWECFTDGYWQMMYSLGATE